MKNNQTKHNQKSEQNQSPAEEKRTPQIDETVKYFFKEHECEYYEKEPGSCINAIIISENTEDETFNLSAQVRLGQKVNFVGTFHETKTKPGMFNLY